MSVTLTPTGIVFPDSSFQPKASIVFTNATSKAASGSWIVPIGVTTIAIALFGGGGGGGGGSSSGGDSPATYWGGDGGLGGSAISKLNVIQGGTVSYTIGAGGTGSLTNGTSGGTSTAIYGPTTVTCTGGAGGTRYLFSNGLDGADGVGNGSFNDYGAAILPSFPLDNDAFFDVLNFTQGALIRPYTAANTPLNWTLSLNPRYIPGARGQGGYGFVDGSGGIGGALFIIY